MLILQLHLPHVITNSMQALCALSHLYIKIQTLKSCQILCAHSYGVKHCFVMLDHIAMCIAENPHRFTNLYAYIRVCTSIAT